MWEQSPSLWVLCPCHQEKDICLGPRSSQPALQTDYPARAHYYLKRRHRIWNFTVKLKSRRSNSFLTHVEKIEKLLYFDQRIWIGHNGLMNLSPGVSVFQWKDEMFTWSSSSSIRGIFPRWHQPDLTPQHHNSPQLCVIYSLVPCFQ